MGREQLAGTWQCYKDENLDKMLEAMGIGWIKRKAAGSSKPKLSMEINGDTINVKGNNEETIIVGQVMEKTSPLTDAKMKFTPSWEGDALVVNVEPAGDKGKPHNVTREIVGDDMVTTIKVDGIVAKRHFKRV